MLRKSFLRKLEPVLSSLPLPQKNGEVLIIGMPKSGTTAVAKLFGACSGLTVCSDPFNQLDQRGIEFRKELFSNKISLEQLWRRHRTSFSGEVVKDPNFPLMMDQLLTFRPEAKKVFLIRNPYQNIRSILNRLGIPGHQDQIDSSSGIPKTWSFLLTGSTPSMPGASYIERLAWRWRVSTEGYLDHKEQCILIRYEDFNQNKVESIKSLVKECGLAPRNIIEHLVDHQFQPKGAPATDLRSFFGGSNWAKIDEITGPLLHEFRYHDQSTR